MSQEAGSKAQCINNLFSYGYQRNHILMIGDAPGDMKAAKVNGVCFFPILTAHEETSWRLVEEAAQRLRDETYEGEYQEQLLRTFKENLRA